MIKNILLFCSLTFISQWCIAEPIEISLNTTKNLAGLGDQLLTLDPNQAYQFTCELVPVQIPPAGTIFLDITVCDTHQLHHCSFAYSEGHADLKQPMTTFKFSPQQHYIGKKSNFSVIIQYIPLNDHQQALARYQLFCNYMAYK
jgi:hypothetical protein